jgi:serine/threonine protein kinase
MKGIEIRPMSDFAPDIVLDGRFRLIAPHDDRGLGDCWSAHDSLGGAEVLVKLLPPFGDDANRARAFEDLANRLVRCSHHSIARTLSHGTSFGRSWLVLDAVPGHSLRYIFARAHDGGTAPAAGLLANVLDRACEAIAYAHATTPALVHGGIDPESIVVFLDDEALRVSLLDFGLATLLGDRLSGGRSSDYTAPELDDEPGGAGVACDVFALGAIALECTTDPAASPSAESANFDAFSVVSLRRDDIPPAVTLVASRATQLDPDRRPPDVASLRAALAEAWESARRAPAPALAEPHPVPALSRVEALAPQPSDVDDGIDRTIIDAPGPSLDLAMAASGPVDAPLDLDATLSVATEVTDSTEAYADAWADPHGFPARLVGAEVSGTGSTMKPPREVEAPGRREVGPVPTPTDGRNVHTERVDCVEIQSRSAAAGVATRDAGRRAPQSAAATVPARRDRVVAIAVALVSIGLIALLGWLLTRR